MAEVETTVLEVLPATALESMTRGEVDIQIATARRYPRSLKLFRDRALEIATIDEETAASCFYAVPRAGKTVEGPGIRLAEICATAYGNLRIAARVVEIGDSEITIVGMVHDLETNVAVSVDVKRSILDKNGKRYKQDLIVNACNAGVSIAMRNAIFRIISKSFIDPIYREAKKVAVGDAKTLTARRDQVLARLMQMGATTERVLARLELPGIDDIGLSELAMLIGFGTAIKDGDTSVDEVFPPVLKVTKPNFISGAAPAPAPASEPQASQSTAEDAANSLTIGDEIEKLGAALFAEGWPDARVNLFRDVTQGATQSIEGMNPVDLAQALAELRKVAESTESQKKGGK